MLTITTSCRSIRSITDDNMADSMTTVGCGHLHCLHPSAHLPIPLFVEVNHCCMVFFFAPSLWLWFSWGEGSFYFEAVVFLSEWHQLQLLKTPWFHAGSWRFPQELYARVLWRCSTLWAVVPEGCFVAIAARVVHPWSCWCVPVADCCYSHDCQVPFLSHHRVHHPHSFIVIVDHRFIMHVFVFFYDVENIRKDCYYTRRIK